MPKRTHAPAMLAALLLSVGACRAIVPGYTPPAGYDADPLNLTADTFAVASDGRPRRGHQRRVRRDRHRVQPR